MGKFNVKQKLGVLIFFAIVMLVIVGGAGLLGAKQIQSALSVISEEPLAKLQAELCQAVTLARPEQFFVVTPGKFRCFSG